MKAFFRVSLVICIFCVMSMSLFSQSTSVISQLNEAINQRNSEQVKSLLVNNRSSRSYGEYEAHILKKARELLISNELDFAAEISLAVIDNNLDNFDAVALYTSIDTAIKTRDAKIKAEEERRQIEEMRIMANTAKEQKQIKKEYQTISNTSSGETVYLDTDYNTHYLPISWAVNLGMADIGLYTDPREVNVKFGFSSFGNIFYHSEDYIIGADYFADTMLFTFGTESEDEQNLDTTLKFSIGYSHDKLIRNFYFRLGFLGYLSNNPDKTKKSTLSL